MTARRARWSAASATPASRRSRAWTASTPDRGPGQAFGAIPGLDEKLVLDPARCDLVARRENVVALGPSGTGKTHAMIGLGLAACQRGVKTRFATAAAIAHEMIEARDEKRLLRLQKTLATYERLIIDELVRRLSRPHRGHGPPHRPAVQDRRRAPPRADQPALQARRHDHHLQPALRRVDDDLRGRAPHRRSARSAHPPRPHPRDERPVLPPRAEPLAQAGYLTPSPRRKRRSPRHAGGFCVQEAVAGFCGARLADVLGAIDTLEPVRPPPEHRRRSRVEEAPSSRKGIRSRGHDPQERSRSDRGRDGRRIRSGRWSSPARDSAGPGPAPRPRGRGQGRGRWLWGGRPTWPPRCRGPRPRAASGGPA